MARTFTNTIWIKEKVHLITAKLKNNWEHQIKFIIINAELARKVGLSPSINISEIYSFWSNKIFNEEQYFTVT